MDATLSAEEIASEVAAALEATLELEVFSERIRPYTQAELSFMQDFVTRALVGVMQKVSG